MKCDTKMSRAGQLLITSRGRLDHWDITLGIHVIKRNNENYFFVPIRIGLVRTPREKELAPGTVDHSGPHLFACRDHSGVGQHWIFSPLLKVLVYGFWCLHFSLLVCENKLMRKLKSGAGLQAKPDELTYFHQKAFELWNWRTLEFLDALEASAALPFDCAKCFWMWFSALQARSWLIEECFH